MKKLFSALAVITMTLAVLTGCGASDSANNESVPAETKSNETVVEEISELITEPETQTDIVDTKKIIDCSGTEVEIPTKIDKVVCTNPSAVAFMNAMGVDEKIVGTHGSILNQSWVHVFDEGRGSVW